MCSLDSTDIPGPEDSSPSKPAVSVRTFLFAIATDTGPRLVGFRISSLLIGRLPDNHLALNHGSVSRRHVRLTVSQAGVFVEDMQSQNGTTINGVRLKDKHPLRPGDILRVGHVPMFYFGFINPDSPPVVELSDGSLTLNPIVSSTF